MSEVKAGNGFLGFFDSADQEEPTYDPPHNAPCPICHQPVCPPLMTISLMWYEPEDRERSYFYRIHKECYESHREIADKAALSLMEGRLH